MGRITINGTQAGFSCKKEVSLALWDVKTNRAKGKSEEARTLNQELDNIKAQITRHYQYICDHDSFVTAKKVYNRYVIGVSNVKREGPSPASMRQRNFHSLTCFP